MGAIGDLFRDVKQQIGKLRQGKYGKAGWTWLDTRKLKALPLEKENSFPFFNGTIYFYDPYELLHGAKEIFCDEIYKVSLPENAVIIDCGAHIGLSVLYFKLHNPSASIIAFEPDSNNFRLLEKNIGARQFKNVSLRNEAVWIENKMLSFDMSASMSSRIENTSSVSGNVKGVRLKELLTERVNFLKIDIEGAEYDVIKDIAAELKNVDNLFLEYHGTFEQNHQLNEILNIITSVGFSYYIKEAADVYPTPFARDASSWQFQVQLNIFCFRN